MLYNKSTRKAAAMMASSSTGGTIPPPSIAGIYTGTTTSTAGVQSPTIIICSTLQTNLSTVRFEGERKPYFLLAPLKMPSYPENNNNDKNKTIKIINETDRVQVLTCKDITDNFFTAPPHAFQSNCCKTYAIFYILIPTCYRAN